MDPELLSSCSCPNPCNVLSYEPSLSTAIFPSQYAGEQYQALQNFDPVYVRYTIHHVTQSSTLDLKNRS